MLHLLGTGGELGLGAAVNDVHVGAQTAGAPGGVHSHVAAAHYRHLLALEGHDGGIGALLVGLHQVDAGEELVGGVHTLEVLAGDVHEHGQARAGTDEHGLEALLLHELVDGDGPTDDHVCLDLHAQRLEPVHFLLDNGLGQTELGDAVHQHAAGQMQGLVHGDLVSLPGQVAGTGQAGGAGPDDGHLMAVGGGTHGLLGGVGVVPVGHKPLQAADAHALGLDAAHALGFALRLLGADPAADGGQGAVLSNDLVGGLEIALRHLGDELGNMDLHRAAGHAGHVLAAEAPLGLVDGLLPGVAQGHLFKVAGPDHRVLVGHGVLIRTHIRHLTLPPA